MPDSQDHDIFSYTGPDDNSCRSKGLDAMMTKFLLCVLSMLLFLHPASAEAVSVTGVTLDKQNTTITMAAWGWGLGVLVPTVAPADATNKKVTWSSSNEAVATVTDGGMIKGTKKGIADITVKTVDGGFTAVCRVEVIGNIESATPRYSSNKSEVAAKTAGFGEDDFEIVDGKVVIRRSIAEGLARKLLEADDIEVVLLPWFEAGVTGGKVASVRFSVTASMLQAKHSVDGNTVLLLNVTSPNTGEFLTYVDSNFDDGDFYFMPKPYPDDLPGPRDPYYELYTFIRDGGKFDLDQTENSMVVGQSVIVRKAQPKEAGKSGGGCNVNYGSIALLLAVFASFTISERRKSCGPRSMS